VSSSGSDGTGFALGACQKSQLDTEPAMHAMSGRAAARRVFSAVYDCLRQLMRYNSNTDAAKSAVLAILNIFPNNASRSNNNKDNWAMERLDLDNASVTDVIKRCRACCRKFSKILPIDQDGNPINQQTTVGSFLRLEQVDTILLLLEGLYRVAKAAQQQAQSSGDFLSAGDIQNLGKIQATLHKYAEAMLKIDWSPPGSDYKAQQGWKGRYTVMSEVLRLMLTNAREPPAVAKRLAATVLPNVTGQGGTSTRTALESLPPYSSLFGATIPVWYKAIMTCLLQVWEHEVIASLVTINKSSDGGALSVDDEAKEMLKSRMMTCGEVFKIMMTLVKHQESKVAIHIQAVVGCGKFIEQFLKVLPLWTKMFGKKKDTTEENNGNQNNMEEFVSLVKAVQKGGRIAQILCAEGKTKQSMPLTAKVPQVKRTIERFMFHLKAFFTEAGGVEQFTVGALKHKNLMGHEVPSNVS
jgi:Fanconi anemia group D2 protein